MTLRLLHHAVRIVGNPLFRFILAVAILFTQWGIAQASGEVGNGSPADCTAAALEDALAGGGTVTFNCGPNPHTITIGEQMIATDTVIDGGDLITLSGGDANRLFVVNDGASLTLDQLTLIDGKAVEEGGALLVMSGGSLLLRDSTVRDSYVQNNSGDVSYGGGIAIRGTAQIIDSRVINNTAEHGAGGIDNSGGIVTIENSIIEGNRADLFAGIDNGGEMTIRNSVIRDNVAGTGGGIGHVNGNLAIQDSVVISNAATYDFGGGLAVYVGKVTIEQTDIVSNSAPFGGGGIYVNPNGDPPASVVVRDSHIAFNFTTANLPPVDELNVFGGGIYNGAMLTLERVAISSNRSGSGGGLFSYSVGSAIMRDSTFDRNIAEHIGGGMWLTGDGEQSLTNVTVSDNEAGTYGGGILITGTLTLQNATLYANRAPDGAALYNQGTVTVANTILAAPLDGTNCGVDGLNAPVIPAVSGGNNLASDDSCALTGDGDQQDTDPLLGDLTDNGGSTLTRLPQEGSPAIDNGVACAGADQRGVLRPQGDDCDIGAVEVGNDTTPPLCGGLFAASADTYAGESQASDNFGPNGSLRLAKQAGSNAHILLAFDLTTLPDDATVTSAILELAVGRIPTGLPYEIEVFDLTEGWDENAVTWGDRPANGNGYGAQSYGMVRGKLQIDVTALVARLLNGEVAESSILLAPAAGDDFTLWLLSREGATSSQYAPRLVIECGPPVPPVVDLPNDPPLPPNEQAAGYQALQADSDITVTVRVEAGAVNFASFDVSIPEEAGDTPVERAEWFLNEYNELLAIRNPAEEFQLIRQSNDGMHVFFRQLHNGIPVLAAELAVHMDEDSYLSLNGGYVPHVLAPDIPLLTAQQAEELALATSEVADLVVGDTQLQYVDLGLLAVPDSDTRLTWQVNLARGNQFAKLETAYVDAFTGEIVARISSIAEGLDIDLEDGNDQYSDQLCGLFDDDDIDRNSAPPESVAAWDNTQRVYIYFLTNFGRDSYDGDEEQAEVNIHVQFRPSRPGGPNTVNAGYMRCDIFVYARGTSTLDIVAHEWTHAVDESEGKLIYLNDSGAIDESYADIFGHLVDPANFLIGENNAIARPPIPGVAGCPVIQAARDMSNPPCYGDPDHVLPGTSGDGVGKTPAVAVGTVANDNGGVHNNSGILNKAAFLIIQGGTFNGIEVRAIGREKAKWLFYNVHVHRLTSGSTFQNARDLAVQEAIDLANAPAPHNRGFDDVQVYHRSTKYNEACTVRNAYAAVGIGNGDVDCDGVEDNIDPDADGDWIPNALDNCPNVFNPGQANLDRDNMGDECDTDDDGDLRADTLDNCPRVANPGWADWNTNGIGDACEDSDGDSVLDTIDNCRIVFNPGQENLDRDFGPTSGDACDPDIDGDLINNPLDNCPVHRNPGQEDETEFGNGLPRDGIGDACDLCPLVSSPDNTDLDNDGQANPCDVDDDGDRIWDVDDNCPLVPNEDQWDWNENDIGYVCDPEERAQFGAVLKGINDRVVEFNPDWLLPVPICPQCGVNILPKDYETVIQVVLDAPFQAAIVDGNGGIVAKTNIAATTQVLRFNAAPFAAQGIVGVAAEALAPHSAQSEGALLAYNQMPAPDELGYYLVIEPAGGSDPGRTYTLSLSVDEGIEEPNPVEIFLPFASSK